MREFDPPEIDTKKRGKINLKYAFQITIEYSGKYETDTPRGGRVYQEIVGGTVEGRLNGRVYPKGGGGFPAVRPDGVQDLNAHILLRANNGEWLYVRHFGYRRPDGYYRIAAYMDADERGEHTWINETVFLATASESEDGLEATFTYYEAA